MFNILYMTSTAWKLGIAEPPEKGASILTNADNNLHNLLSLGHRSKVKSVNVYMTLWKSNADNTLHKFVHKLKHSLQESIEFRQTALEATLQLVYSIIWELKTHEIIENTVIMQVSEKRATSIK